MIDEDAVEKLIGLRSRQSCNRVLRDVREGLCLLASTSIVGLTLLTSFVGANAVNCRLLSWLLNRSSRAGPGIPEAPVPRLSGDHSGRQLYGLPPVLLNKE